MVVLLVLYFLTFIFCLNAVNFLLIFIFLEIMSWGFSFFLSANSLKYLLLQSFFFLGGLLSVFVFTKIVFLFFFLKLGLPPFYSWVVLLAQNITKIVFLFFFLIHKLLPLLFIAKTEISILMMGVSMCVCLLIMIELSSLMMVFIISSMIQSLWMLFCLLVSSSLFLVYWAYYSGVLLMFFYSIKNAFLHNMSQMQSLFSGISWLVIAGLPPFLMFWLKLGLLVLMLNILSVFWTWILLVSSILSMMIYYRVFVKYLVISSTPMGRSVSFSPLVIIFF